MVAGERLLLRRSEHCVTRCVGYGQDPMRKKDPNKGRAEAPALTVTG